MSHSNDTVHDSALQCAGKRGYASKTRAKRHARRAESVIGRLSAYRCPHCNLFHLGHRRSSP